MTVTIEVDGNLVEFPDEATAQAFFANQQGGGQPAPAAEQSERGIGQVIYDNVIGDPNDGVDSFGERAGTWLNRAGETMTFGTVGDEAAAGVTGMLPGRTYEGELERYRGNEEAMSGLGRTSADLTGGVAGALGSMLIPGAGPALATAGTSGRAAGLMATLGRGTAAGAGMGGAYGFMEGEGGVAERAQEAGQGAAIGGAVGGATAGLGRIVQALMDRRAGQRAITDAARNAPTSEALRAQGQNLYQQIDDAGVAIRPDRLRSELGAIADDLRAEGAGYTGAETVMPGTRAIMNAAGEVGDGANTIPFRELDVFRRFVGNTGASSARNPVDSRTSAQVIGRLDDFVQNLGPQDVDAGDIQTLQTLIPRAREVWSRMSRSQLVDDAIEAGSGETSGYLGAGASGLRNQFGRILRNENLRRGFTPSELSVMNRVVRGTIPENLIYNLGSGLGNVATTLTATALGGAGGVPGMIGGLAAGGTASAAMNRAASNIAQRNAEIARAVIANGRLPAQLPVADEGMRRVVEALALRSGAVGAQ
jgi:hypothetical protein